MKYSPLWRILWSKSRFQKAPSTPLRGLVENTTDLSFRYEMRNIDWEIPPTHNFSQLLRLLSGQGSKWQKEFEIVRVLTLDLTTTNRFFAQFRMTTWNVCVIRVKNQKSLDCPFDQLLTNRTNLGVISKWGTQGRLRNPKNTFYKKHFILSLSQSFWIDQSLHFTTLRTVFPTGKTAGHHCPKPRFGHIRHVSTLPKNQHQRSCGFVPFLCTFWNL